jgi:hypothetical protein
MRSTSPHARAQLKEPTKRLQALRLLEFGWDSYGGAPPSVQAIAQAHGLLLEVGARFGGGRYVDIAPDVVAASPDGGVQLEWCSAGLDVEVAVGPDGALRYLLVDRRAGEPAYHERADVSREDVLTQVEIVLAAAADG